MIFNITIKERLKRLIPRKIYLLWMNYRLRRFHGLSTEEIFSAIYEEKLWGADGAKKYSSGEGTVSENAIKYIAYLKSFITVHEVKSIVDVGCGEYSLMHLIFKDLPEVDYTGVDIVPQLIEYNQEKYGSENARFLCLNAIKDELPKAELITIRQVLQHLSNEQISHILDKLKTYPYVLITEHLPIGKGVVANKDKAPGPDIRLYYNSGVFIEYPPFKMPARNVLEYREDIYSLNKIQPAVIRTYLIENEPQHG